MCFMEKENKDHFEVTTERQELKKISNSVKSYLLLFKSGVGNFCQWVWKCDDLPSQMSLSAIGNHLL